MNVFSIEITFPKLLTPFSRATKTIDQAMKRQRESSGLRLPGLSMPEEISSMCLL